MKTIASLLNQPTVTRGEGKKSKSKTHVVFQKSGIYESNVKEVSGVRNSVLFLSLDEGSVRLLHHDVDLLIVLTMEVILHKLWNQEYF